MVIEIEFYKGDTLLYGTEVPFAEFERQVKTIEKIYDKKKIILYRCCAGCIIGLSLEKIWNRNIFMTEIPIRV